MQTLEEAAAEERNRKAGTAMLNFLSSEASRQPGLNVEDELRKEREKQNYLNEAQEQLAADRKRKMKAIDGSDSDASVGSDDTAQYINNVQDALFWEGLDPETK